MSSGTTGIDKICESMLSCPEDWKTEKVYIPQGMSDPSIPSYKFVNSRCSIKLSVFKRLFFYSFRYLYVNKRYTKLTGKEKKTLKIAALSLVRSHDKERKEYNKTQLEKASKCALSCMFKEDKQLSFKDM